MRLTSSSAIGVLSMLLNFSLLGVRSPLIASKVDGPTVATRFPAMQYSRVQFRKDRDGTVIAFEKCGCEAAANAFRPCRIHHGDAPQGARLIAEARYHSIQKCCQQLRGSKLASAGDISH
ncbi:MAG: hypothetical protein DMG78_16180 [Acidobacteria bacterium]|nr:MAG: hypothetical protein DMG78_16180 [Acidobacteriota bacterium]